MADEPSKEPDDDKDKPDQPDPDAGAKTALKAERDARKAAEKKAGELEARLQELEDRDKSDGQKLTDRATAAEQRADKAEARALRLEVAHAKGLTPGQAKRLTGTTQEELEADADELLTDFAPAPKGDDDKPTPGGRPKERLRGGGAPLDEPEETDPRKLADLVPRN